MLFRSTYGNLPPGIYLATWNDIVSRFGRTPHRQRLLAGLEAALEPLRVAGCRRVYINGSFVTDKEVPGDIDVAWEPAGVDVVHLLELEPLFGDFSARRAAQKAKFLCEFFPASFAADLVGNTFLDFFQTDKHTGERKGIIALDL